MDVPYNSLSENHILSATEYPVFTVGHSNHPPELFVGLLQRHSVEEVVDVRSSPYSRYSPHFNKDALEGSDVDIGYVYLGGELGGRPKDRSCYDDDGRVLFDQVAETDPFIDALGVIIRAADERRIALMCAEKEPLECHRTLWWLRHWWRGAVIEHILADGGLESHETAMDRLLDSFKLPRNGDMFRNRYETIAEALARQAKRVAYVGSKQPTRSDDWDDTF